VVADTQYANLGLMLMGLLAQVRAIVQTLRPEPEFVEGVKDDKPGTAIGVEESFDFGEVISREDTTRHEEENSSGIDEEEVKLKKPKAKKGILAEKESEKKRVRDKDGTNPQKKKQRRKEV